MKIIQTFDLLKSHPKIGSSKMTSKLSLKPWPQFFSERLCLEKLCISQYAIWSLYLEIILTPFLGISLSLFSETLANVTKKQDQQVMTIISFISPVTVHNI